MKTQPLLYLASKSPRRQELLTYLAIDFQLIEAEIDETPELEETASNYVRRLAIEKAQAGRAKLASTAVVLGADTIVVIDNKILGKPVDQQDAQTMLTLLSNRTHQVMTAIAVVSPLGVFSEIIETDVSFRAITETEMAQYWLTGEPCDKAGGYGIQGIGGKFVQRINGSYHSVVGLPLVETEQLIKLARHND
ncbi:MAG: septum formation inhibitor Maf [Gammaproteobacteria bacterium]|nr:septum formation inhibitor Maf [Gammaproteobacteria bacterium]